MIPGGVGRRLADDLPRSGFGDRFNLLTHPQPGLLGAAAAFAREHP